MNNFCNLLKILQKFNINMMKNRLSQKDYNKFNITLIILIL